MTDEPFQLTLVGEHDGFRQNIRMAFALLQAMANESSCPPINVTAILADDFVSAVESAQHRAGIADGRPFALERIGGLVSAKNVPTARDYSTVEIVFNSELWEASNDSPMAEGIRLWIALHELAHPVFGRLRHASGALDGVPFPSHTPSEVARSMIRVAVEEMRCDQIVDRILSNVASVRRPDGEELPLRLGMLHDLGYCQAVIEALDERVYPGWPDLVEDYQYHQLSLDEMWARLATSTDGMLTLLGRAHAEALSVDYPGPLSNEAATSPGTQLYLGPMWGRIVAAAMNQPLIPSLDTFAQLEAELLDEGENAIHEMWRKLGVEVEELGDRKFALWISEPTRMPQQDEFPG
ncbi:hypothetical protein AB0C04_02285 [Micromonospora sp. NPDC048909]|uniref:hypothetical protein n=1 Tax=Micromonospora sp. NPDC048909 TaxID=3155643 RepID=UPI0033BFFBA6